MPDAGRVFIGDVLTPGQQAAQVQAQEAQAQDLELRRLSVQSLMEQRKAQIAQQQRQKEEDDFISQTAQQFSTPNGPDYDKIIAEVSKRYPERGLTLQKQRNDSKLAAIKARNDELDIKNAELDYGRTLLGMMRDPQTFKALAPRFAEMQSEDMQALSKALGPEWTDQTPQLIQSLIDGSVPEKERLARQKELAALYGKDPEKSFLQDIADSRNQAEYEEAFKALGFFLGPEAQEGYTLRFGPEWSPAIVEAAKQRIGQAAPASSGFTLSPGQKRFDAQGNPIAYVPPRPVASGGGGGGGGQVSTRLPPQATAVYDRVLVGVPGTRVGAIRDGLNRLASNGAPEEDIKSFLKLAAVETLGQADKTVMLGRMQTLTALKDAEKLLGSVPTGYLKGTWEDTMRALGTTSDPRLVELGTQMGTILANYMRSISGAAIADQEAQRLSKLIPNYKNSLTVNKGQLKGFADALRSFDNSFYQYKFGNHYDWVMGSGKSAPSGGSAKLTAEELIKKYGGGGD